MGKTRRRQRLKEQQAQLNALFESLNASSESSAPAAMLPGIPPPVQLVPEAQPLPPGANCQCEADTPDTSTPDGLLQVQTLAHILRFIDIQHRLCSCALVSTRWAEAAVVATDSIVLHTTRTDDTVSLQHWLLTHGHQLTQLQLSGPGCKVLSALPCPKLQDLLLHRCQLLLEPEGQLCSQLAAATGLSRVSLMQITQTGEGSILTAVAALPSLQHLCWDGPLVAWGSPATDAAEAGDGSELLLQLSHVTHLELHGGFRSGSLWHLGCLTHLQHLELLSLYAVKLQELLGLQPLQRLTGLKLGDVRGTITASTLPCFSILTALQHMELFGSTLSCTMQLSVLEHNVQLQHLFLGTLEVLSSSGMGSAAADSPLAALQHLHQLTHLELQGLDLSQCPTKHLSGLTAGSLLQHLGISHCGLPGGTQVWQHVFPSGRTMPNLRSLNLHSVAPQLDGKDLNALMRCCPGLRHLDATNAITPSAAQQPQPQLRKIKGLVRL